MNKQVVNQLVSEALSENNSLFLIDLSLHQDNKIVVQIDGKLGVPLQECIRISRYIEQRLDKEVEDYALEVTTPDIAEPLKDIRQYHKNLQRTLVVTLKDKNKVEGILTQITEQTIVLESKVREPKPIGKGKITVIKNIEVAFENIENAIVKIMF
ncbi:MAG: ribosome assembly cofactor RimP [Flavobacteriaceae bacterium]|nr:ribosome assembly cofactor RimP [Flavobacteriaceae bacterium]